MKKLNILLTLGLAVLTFATQPLLAGATKAAEPERIAFGEEVDITKYLVPGKTVIFDFTSEYCPPCRAISPYLDKLHANRDDIMVVKVDINREGHKGIDWRSPVAVQYEMNSIPHFKVYGPDGEKLAEGDAARDMVTDWFE
jgi:thiol-disulfide isomerase/thioredoxin|uniref:thioredoxin family protein n=1 Tax=Cephaloticoccus sp. TaxID=1985742 RepID=UPI00404B991D